MRLIDLSLFLSTIPVALLLAACPSSALPTEVDVVIVGAGSSGLAAAARLQEFADAGVSYVVLEAQSKVGGRVQSRVLDFGNFEGEYTVEDGANWITDFPGNPIFELAQEYDIGMVLQEFFDIDAYQDGVSIPKRTMDLVHQEFDKAWNCLQTFTNVPYNNGGKDGFGQTQVDIGAIALLEMCGWSITNDSEDNIKYFWQWYYMEFEYAQEDVSLSTFPEDAFFKPTYLVTDQNGGFQRLFEDFMEDKVNTDNVFLNSEVTLIDYTKNVAEDNHGYNAKVHVGGVDDPILCKRVISTLSVGILEEKKETLFHPAIDTDLLDLEMMQYIKIFYQFENKFWGEEEFILTMNDDSDKRGNCEHWQNLATTGKGGNTDIGRKKTTNEFTTEDSNILFCTIITESYFELVEEDTGELSDATLNSFLGPLADAFGSDYEDPIDKFYFAWNNNEYSGGGSYSNWQVRSHNTWEDNVERFSYFWGGWGSPYGSEPTGWYKPVNGYQMVGEEEEWVLHLSGTGSCFESWGFVHGGFEAGLRSANYILYDWGLVKESATLSACEDF